MSARTIRTGLFAATAIALATLSLTACGGEDAQDEGASSTLAGDTGGSGESGEETGDGAGDSEADSQGSTESAGASAAGSTGSQDATSQDSGSEGSGPDEGTDASRNAPCTGSNTETTVTEVSRPLNHLLITVTNTGSESCDLLHYPILRFEDAQSVPPVFEDSMPQAVVTLAPDESGYAGVLLAAADGSGQNPVTATTLEVMFQNRDGDSDGESATPPLPEGGVSFDDTLTVTYWQRHMDDALTW
ncbi:DUF4232 domain-containing protein [Streptomyces sp. 4N509B]|uniref:DUF4232 domain-containing protein n=1 Tax=Streptomyces sp. 4N509B TaxID=3457413 RepID=UPI003FD23596